VATEGVYTPITPEPADEFRDRKDRKRLWRGVADSLLLHGVILALVFGLWRVAPPPEIVFPAVSITVAGSGGASGSPGGSGGAAKLPGQRNAAAAPSALSSEAKTAPSDVTPLESDAAPPLPTPKPAPAIAKLDTAPPKPHQHKPAPHPRVAKATTEPKPQAPPKPAPAVTAQPAPAPTSSAPPTAIAGSPAAVGTGMEGVGSAGNGNFGISQGPGGPGRGTGSPDDYLDRVRRHLQRYKHYPEEALKKKQEGTVMVAFTLAHDGTVTRAWIERSSGNPLLDQAALAMLHDGSPVPPVPERYWSRSGPIIMPVDFTIGFFDRVFR